MQQQLPTIASMQEATKQAAAATVREREQQQPPQGSGTGNNGQQQPLPPGQQQEPAFDLASHIKTKYGIDLKEDDIVTRLTGNGNTPPSSVKKSAEPKQDDISDDDIGGWFETNKKPNLVSKHRDNAKKDDIALVKEAYLAQVKEQIKGITDAQADALFLERYYIPDPNQGNEDDYTPEEQKLGAFMLKQEADRLRNMIGFQVDGVRNMLYQDRLDQYNQELFTDTVNSFMSTQPPQLQLSLGKSGAIDLGDYPIVIEDNTKNTVAEIMRTPMNLLKKFQADGADGIDLQKMYSYLLKAELFDDALKSTAVDYYSKGVDSVKNTLNNYPDLDKTRSPERKPTITEEQKKAIEHNAKQIGQNTGRGRTR